MGGILHLFTGQRSCPLLRNMPCDLLWFRFKMTSLSSKPNGGEHSWNVGLDLATMAPFLGMPHPRACPFNLYLFFIHIINQVIFSFFGLWRRWQYIWMKWTHLMNTEHCFKNSLVIAIMFKVALGNWGKQYKIHPGNMYNILFYIYKLATKAPSLVHAAYGYWGPVEKLAASLCWHNVI